MHRVLRALVPLAAFLLAGCMSDGHFSQLQQTQTVLTSNNYRVLETGLRGSDTGFQVFGIGPSATYAKALQKIRILAELEDRPRALINVSEDTSSYHFGIVSGQTIVLTADLIEFTGPPTGH